MVTIMKPIITEKRLEFDKFCVIIVSKFGKKLRFFPGPPAKGKMNEIGW